MKLLPYYILLLIFFPASYSFSQERVGPLRYNAVVHDVNARNIKPLLKTTADTINLPFFDDFTGNSIFPDATKWMEKQAFINNNMCVSPPTRGVASLDALNEHGIPYDTTDNSAIVTGDSLTSLPIDFSTLKVSDSVYLSFFYQPQGTGFYPEVQDSLMLFMHKKDNDWVKVWSIPGSTIIPFTQVLIPVLDTDYFYKGFQFRFVNLSSFDYSGSNWNIDYVRLDKNRNMNDTAINDLSFIGEPSFLLNDYTYMPYRQFMADPVKERGTQHSDTIQNYTNAIQSVPYGYTARETTTSTFLASTSSTLSMPAYSQSQVAFPDYTTTIPLTGIYNKVIFENTYYLQSPASDTHKQNDTIVKKQVFDNYLAYDDGSAEKSYFLNLFPLLPGYVAVEYHLNKPDTMQGMAIYFGRQVPIPTFKNFAFFVYSHLQGIDGSPTTDSIYWQDMNRVGYTDTVSHFWIYKFNQPVPLPTGTFYAGIFQPAFSGSDSIYFGLDASRVGGNHVYYNVLNVWNSSSVSGALMMRPLLGQAVIGTDVPTITPNEINWSISPNPARNKLQIQFPSGSGFPEPGDVFVDICDIAGKRVYSNLTKNIHSEIDIGTLLPGTYLISISVDGIKQGTKKFIKE